MESLLSCTGTISVVVLDAAAATDVAPATVVKAFAGVFIHVSGRAVAVSGELCVL